MQSEHDPFCRAMPDKRLGIRVINPRCRRKLPYLLSPGGVCGSCRFPLEWLIKQMRAKPFVLLPAIYGLLGIRIP